MIIAGTGSTRHGKHGQCPVAFAEVTGVAIARSKRDHLMVGGGNASSPFGRSFGMGTEASNYAFQNLKEKEGNRIGYLPSHTGGVLEEVLHAQGEEALEWGRRFAVHHTEGTGVVVFRDVL